MSKVWFITGTSSGFGRALTEALLAKGEQVVGTARRPETLNELSEAHSDHFLPVYLDATQPDSIAPALESAVEHFGHLDVVVNNAGYGTIGGWEEFTDEQIYRQFETNFFGAAAVIRHALPYLRANGGGHILNVSSIGGFTAFPGSSLYSASKFALEALSESLAQELAAQKIRVTIIEPGAFRTGFNGGALEVAENRRGEYDEITGKFEKWMKDTDGKQPGDPAKAAAAMIAVVESETPPLRLLLGNDAWDAAQKKLETAKTDFDTWRETTLGCNFPGAQTSAIGG